MKAPATDFILHAPSVLSEDDKRNNTFYAFTPVVESECSEEPFLTENFISLLMKPNMTKIPLMTGVNSHEGLIMSAKMLSEIELYAANPIMLVPQDLLLEGDRLKEAADEIKRFFFGDDDITAERLPALVDIMTDNMYVMPAYVVSELHARYQNE